MGDISVTEKINKFWKYASTLTGTHTIEDVFIDWISINNDTTINELKNIWEGVNNDIKTAFDAKDIESITNLIQTVMQSKSEPEAPISMDDIGGEPELGAEPAIELEPAAPATGPGEVPGMGSPAPETESALKQMAEAGGSKETPPELDKPPGEENKDDRDYMLTESLLL